MSVTGATRTSATRLRRTALQYQGLTGKRRIGTGLKGTHKVLEQLGYVQIDTISVVARAHHHTLWTRVNGYRDDHLDKLVKRGDAFEYWFHAAAYLPMRDFRYSMARKNGIKRGERHWARSRDHKLMRQVLDRVRDQGPLKARDFEDTRSGSTGWWDWKPAKRALEQLFMQGDLMSAGRDGFEKRYEIPERILPSDIDTTEPTQAEYAGYLVDTTLRAHGFATAKSFTYGRRGTAIRAAVKTLLAERVDAGTLATAKLNDDLFYGTPAVFDAQTRTPAPVVRILSPFDNAIIQRARSSNIFDFDFQLECYVTETERKWGYYCLPILFADKFVGRMDCKTHRATGTFEIKRLHIEAPLHEAFYAAFAETVLDYAGYQGCGAVTLTSVSPARHAKKFKTLFHG